MRGLSPSPLSVSLRFQNHFTPDQIEQDAKRQQWNQSEQIRIRAFKERIICRRPFLELMEPGGHAAAQVEEAVDDARKSGTGDVAGRQQDAVALIRLGGHFFFSEI